MRAFVDSQRRICMRAHELVGTHLLQPIKCNGPWREESHVRVSVTAARTRI